MKVLLPFFLLPFFMKGDETMTNEELYKRLLNRDDLQQIPILYIVTVAFAVVDEMTKVKEHD